MEKPTTLDNRIYGNAPLSYYNHERYLPSAFDESLSLLEKINRLIYAMHEIGKLTDDMLTKWNEVYHWVMNEGLDQMIGERLDEWLEDGTLADLINNKLLGDMIDSLEDLQKAIDGLETELVNEIQTMLQKFEQEADILINFDVRHMMPEYYTTLNLYWTTVMQALAIDSRHMDIYTTQSNVHIDGKESFTLSRLDQRGRRLDSMHCENGGHGTNIDIEIVNDRVYIWSAYKDHNNQFKLVRFAYNPNTTITIDDTQIFDKFTDKYVVPCLDIPNDKIAFVVKDSEANRKVELRSFDDVKNGKNEVLHEMTIPLVSFQGIAINDTDLYWTAGNNNASSTDYLYLYDLKTGNEKWKRPMRFGKDTEDEYTGGFREPEGILLFRNPNNQKMSLLVSVVTNEALKRENKIYGYHQVGNSAFFQSLTKTYTQNYQLSRNNGYTKYKRPDVTRLDQIDEPGVYYMSTSEANEYADHPNVRNSGWWLEVLPTGGNQGYATLQRLTQRTNSAYCHIYIRTITEDYNGVWTHFAGDAG